MDTFSVTVQELLVGIFLPVHGCENTPEKINESDFNVCFLLIF
jgi:hypothetical protein